MNLDQLIALFRRRADDKLQPYLWKRDEVVDYANDAQKEACRRLILLDSTTPDVCKYAVTSGDAEIALHAKILVISRAKLGSTRLEIVSHRTLDMQLPSWESATGTPNVLVPDWSNGMALLNPVPTSASTLYLTVFRLPLEDMQGAQDEPEIHEEHHPHLIDWMLYRAYMRPDVDTFNAQVAAAHETAFNNHFGPAQSGSDRLRRDAGRSRFEATR